MRQLELFEHLDARHPGHHHIENDDVELPQRRQLQGLFAMRGLLHLKTATHKSTSDRFPKIRIVVNEEQVNLARVVGHRELG